MSKGNATDRATTRLLGTLPEFHALQQRLEMEDVELGVQSLREINPLVRKAAGLDVHDGDLQKENIMQGRKSFVTPADRMKEKITNELEERTPQLRLNDMVPREVHRLTGFFAFICGSTLWW
jgi:hypothetical protein